MYWVGDNTQTFSAPPNVKNLEKKFQILKNWGKRGARDKETGGGGGGVSSFTSSDRNVGAIMIVFGLKERRVNNGTVS